MKNFLVLYYASDEAITSMNNMTQKEQEADMQQWMEWMEKNAEHMTDAGTPLGKTYKYNASGVSEGEHKALGYTIMKASSIEDIYKLIASNPHLSWHPSASIEVSEAINLEM